MAKISPVSIKYLIYAEFRVEGSLEKPDVIGAIFGQTEGLLGNDLEMRELQKEGKIGRIEVDLEKKDRITSGTIRIPTALDQSETSLIAAAVETIDKIGPSDAQIEVKKIEDVRGSKRDYILERAKKLMKDFKNSTDSREISNEIRISSRTSEVQEYGEEKLPCGDLSENEVIVVEGRADVLNLMRNGINNVIAMNGTKLPNAIKELGQEKDLTLFVDGDRGGKLIISNVLDNARIKSIVTAPVGREVEELTGKEILMSLRKKISVEEYFDRENRFERENRWNGRQNRNYYRNDSDRENQRRNYRTQENYFERNARKSPERSFEKNSEIMKGENKSTESENSIEKEKVSEKTPFSEEDKEKMKKFSSEIKSTGKAFLLDNNMEKIKEVSVRGLSNSLKKGGYDLKAIVMDGTVTATILNSAEESGCQAIMAKNFSSSETNMKLFSL